MECAQPCELRRERRTRDLELRLVRDLRERATLAGQLGVQLRHRLLAAGIDEERGRVVRELVSRRPLHRPVPQRARPARGSSRPRCGRRRARAAARGTRADSRARRGGRCEARRRGRRATSSSTFACVTSNTSGSSTRTPASSSTSKKRRCRPVAGSMSKNVVRELRVRPEGVLVRRRHVVRDDVEDHAEPGGMRRIAERAKLLLAAEIVGDARRIDDVVAVSRALRACSDGER